MSIVWKPVQGFEERYQVNAAGQIRWNDRGTIKLMTPYLRYGKLVITLSKNGKHSRHRVAELIAEAFLVPRPSDSHAVQKDFDPTNNRIEHLEWRKGKPLRYLPITNETIRQRLSYDPETGIFTWRQGKRKGRRAGYFRKKGHVTITVEGGKIHLAHRLAWLYMTGEWPKKEIDHENRDKHDNRWKNLREADDSENATNWTRSSATGVRGVAYSTKSTLRPWCARIAHRGTQYSLGYFQKLEDACAAYNAAAAEFHGEFRIVSDPNQLHPNHESRSH